MPREAKAEEVGQWLDRAAEDLRVAGLVVDADPPMAGAAVFHCQQAVEKALKGLLVQRGKRPTKTHSIQEIGRAITGTDPDLDQMIADADRLSPYATEFRYPGDLDQPDIDEARRALDLARDVVAKVETRVSAGD
jgi:HEPN domain-containing protein